jgi:NADPH-dependent curcumin reductase CurA
MTQASPNCAAAGGLGCAAPPLAVRKGSEGVRKLGNADQLEKEKYDFLRSKKTFQRCMDYAYKEFHWTKKSL